jgi:flagellar hook assembly protein FlgD
MEIYNLRGQLVRKILTDVEQLPGRYGSSNSPLEITWDGLTEDGTMANNGRYILRMNVRDGKNEVEKLEQIILIK